MSSNLISWLIGATITITVVYGALVGFIAINQEQLVYFPSRYVPFTPDAQGFVYEDVWMTTSDGVQIHGWFLPAPEERGVVLFFHGNAGNIVPWLKIIPAFHDLGLSCFLVDYRGYGQSEGEPFEQGTYYDAEAAWNYLVEQRQVAPDKIIIAGHSLGGGVAAWLAQQHSPGGLILESTFTSMADVGALHYPYLPVYWLTRNEYPTLERLPTIVAPVLVIHSRDDELIPFSHGERLYAAAQEPKMFLELRGSHNGAIDISAEQREAGIAAFVNGVLAP